MFPHSTSRLLLDSHHPQNAQTLHRWFNDPHLHFLTSEDPFSETSLCDVKAMLERWTKPSPHLRFGIHLRETKALIGFGAIACIDEYNQTCLCSLVLGEKRMQGQGLGFECLEAMLLMVFEELKLNRIGAEVFSDNLPSLALFQKAGFQVEGVLREAVKREGGFVDEWKLGLLRKEWEAGVFAEEVLEKM